MSEWLNETLYPGWGQRFEVQRVLARETSEFQDIVIIQTASHGRVLMLDGNIQITEADEFIYQEMIAHVPLLAHGSASHVLIIGAGDGGVLRRVLQHRNTQLVTMVEIDGAVIRLAKQFLPSIAADAWNDPRANVIVGDGIAFAAGARSASYDVIIVDSTDPVGVGEALFSDAFYSDCARILRPGGLVVNQCGVPFMQADELRETSLRRAKFFSHVTAFAVAVPTYVGGLMTIGIASNSPGLESTSEAVIKHRAYDAGIDGLTNYWSPGVHVASFRLPPYIAKHLPS